MHAAAHAHSQCTYFVYCGSAGMADHISPLALLDDAMLLAVTPTGGTCGFHGPGPQDAEGGLNAFRLTSTCMRDTAHRLLTRLTRRGGLVRAAADYVKSSTAFGALDVPNAPLAGLGSILTKLRLAPGILGPLLHLGIHRTDADCRPWHGRP